MNLIKEIIQFFFRSQPREIPALDGVKAFLGCGTEPFDLGLILPLTLFEQPQAFAHNLAGVAESSGGNAGFDEAIEVFSQTHVAGWQAEGSFLVFNTSRIGIYCQP